MRDRLNYKRESKLGWKGAKNTYGEKGSCLKRGVFAASEGSEGTTCIFNGMSRDTPMVLASCIRVIPLSERGLEDPSGSYHDQMIGNEGWQEVFVRHWEWGEFLKWPRREVPFDFSLVAVTRIRASVSTPPKLT